MKRKRVSSTSTDPLDLQLQLATPATRQGPMTDKEKIADLESRLEFTQKDAEHVVFNWDGYYRSEKRKKEDYAEKVKTLNKTVADLEKNIRRLERGVTTSENNLEAEKRQAEDGRNQLANVRKELRDQRSNNNRVQQLLDASENSNEELKKKIEVLESTSSGSEIDMMKDQVEAWKLRAQKAETALKSHIEEQNKIYASPQRQSPERSEEEAIKANEDAENLRMARLRIEALEMSLQESEELRNVLEEQILELKEKLETAEAKKTKFQDSWTASETRLKNSKTTNNRLTELLSKANLKVEQLEKAQSKEASKARKIDELTKKLEAAEKAQKDLQSTADQLPGALSTIEALEKKLEESNNAARTAKLDVSNLRSLMEQAKNAADKEVADLKKKLEDSEAEAKKKLEEEVHIAERTNVHFMQEATRKLLVSEQAKVALQTKFDALQAKFDAQGKYVVDLSMRITNLQQQINNRPEVISFEAQQHRNRLKRVGFSDDWITRFVNITMHIDRLQFCPENVQKLMFEHLVENCRLENPLEQQQMDRLLKLETHEALVKLTRWNQLAVQVRTHTPQLLPAHPMAPNPAPTPQAMLQLPLPQPPIPLTFPLIYPMPPGSTNPPQFLQ